MPAYGVSFKPLLFSQTSPSDLDITMNGRSLQSGRMRRTPSSGSTSASTNGTATSSTSRRLLDNAAGSRRRTPPPYPSVQFSASVDPNFDHSMRKISEGNYQSDSDDDNWSDPCPQSEEPLSAAHNLEEDSTPGRGQAHRGISVPSFLQPLLGLDFVPYLPPSEIATDSMNSKNVKTGKVESSESLLLSNSATRSGISYHSDSEVIVINEDADEILEEKSFSQRDSRTSPSVGPKRLFRGTKGIRKAVSSGFKKIHPRKKKGVLEETEWIEEQQSQLMIHKTKLEEIREKSEKAKKTAIDLDSSIGKTIDDIEKLQDALYHSLSRLSSERTALAEVEVEISVLQAEATRVVESLQQSLQSSASSKSSFSSPILRLQNRRRAATAEGLTSGTIAPSAECVVEDISGNLDVSPLRRRANTDSRLLHHSSSFIRVGDLEISDDELDSSLSNSNHSSDKFKSKNTSSDAGLYYIDHNVALILDKLVDLGFAFATDESGRFDPTTETKRILNQRSSEVPTPGWPVDPWTAAVGKEILVWTGRVEHRGFGHDWPVVKARCVVNTTPRELVEFLLDSSQLKIYNKMSQGRDDLVVLQDDLDMDVNASCYGFPGIAKVMRALNKPKLLPRTIEMLSLWHARPLVEGAFIIVNRSVWEDESPISKSTSMLRSEMLLGVHLIRPCGSGSEITLITHVYAPGVPEMMAKRMAPGNAMSMLSEIQLEFLNRKAASS